MSNDLISTFPDPIPNHNFNQTQWNLFSTENLSKQTAGPLFAVRWSDFEPSTNTGRVEHVPARTQNTCGGGAAISELMAGAMLIIVAGRQYLGV